MCADVIPTGGSTVQRSRRREQIMKMMLMMWRDDARPRFHHLALLFIDRCSRDERAATDSTELNEAVYVVQKRVQAGNST